MTGTGDNDGVEEGTGARQQRRIEVLREAIARGAYRVPAEEVAAAVLAFHRADGRPNRGVGGHDR